MMYLNPFTGEPILAPPSAASRAMLMPVGPPGPRTGQASFAPPPPSAAPALAAIAAEAPPMPAAPPAAPPRQMGEPRPPQVGPLRWGLPQAIAQYIVDQGYKTVPGTGPGAPPAAAPALAAAAGDAAMPPSPSALVAAADMGGAADAAAQAATPPAAAPIAAPPRPAPAPEGVHLANLPPPGMTPPPSAPRAPAPTYPDLIIPDRQVADTSAATAKRFGLSPAAAENLLAFGLQMAASGSKPGATLASSIAEGGMAALKTRRDRKALDAEAANKREEMDLKRATAINEARTQIATLMQRVEDSRLAHEDRQAAAQALAEYRADLIRVQETTAADKKERDAILARIEERNAQSKVDGDAASMYESLAKSATMGGTLPLKPEDEQRIRATVAETLPDSSMAKGMRRQTLASEAASAVQQIQASNLSDADKQARIAQVRTRYQEQLKAIG